MDEIKRIKLKAEIAKAEQEVAMMEAQAQQQVPGGLVGAMGAAGTAGEKEQLIAWLEEAEVDLTRRLVALQEMKKHVRVASSYDGMQMYKLVQLCFAGVERWRR